MSGRRRRGNRALHLSILTVAFLVVLTQAVPAAFRQAGANDPLEQAAASQLQSLPPSLNEPASGQPQATETRTVTPAATATPTVSPTELCQRSTPDDVFCTYRVRAGDTLSELAQAFGIKGGEHFTGADVLGLNNELDVSDNTSLWADATIRVPLASAVLHAVQEEETLEGIAGHYGIDTTEIVALGANKLEEAAPVETGRTVLIPATPASMTVLALRLAERSAARAAAAGLAVTTPASDSSSPPGEQPEQAVAAASPTPARPKTHKVERSDTLSQLAERYGVAIEALASANGIERHDLVVEGRELVIPDLTGVAATEAAAAESGETPEADADGSGGQAAATPTPEPTMEPTPEPTARTAEPPPIETGTPTAVPTATSTPGPASPTPAASSTPSRTGQQARRLPISAAEVARVKEEFSAGYRSAGGPDAHLEHIIERVIRCESSYNVHAFNAAGPFYGLMQFLPSTWAAAGGGDWTSAWQQGANTARLLQKRNPLTQWPVCWLK
jgi:LysM repeat protein